VNPVQSINFAIARSSHEEIDSLPQSRRCRNLWIVGLALIALMLKLVIAFNTVGTNDAVSFYGFAKVLSQHGLEWAYRHIMYFNHPPLIAYYLRGIYALTEQRWCQDLGIHFPFLLRLPGIIADFLVVLVLLRLTKADLRIPTWALALFALSPVSLMVSGFHGNTDPVMVMFLMLTSSFCLRGKSVWCGLFLALSCQIKIIPLLLLPIFFFFWLSRRRAVSFSLPFVSASLVLWAEPLLKFPTLFARNVLLYGSYWGIWGITYWLRLTNLTMFRMETFFYDISPMESFVVTVLKLIIIAAVLMIAWRRRNLGERALFDSVAYAWIVFFVFAPGVCAQYMVWLAPFALVLSPVFYGWLAASSSLFLFFFYNVNAGQFPWYGVISDGRHGDWAPWSLWPWTTLILGMILLWKKAAAADPSLHLSSLQPLREP
jgi:hypothetical protein